MAKKARVWNIFHSHGSTIKYSYHKTWSFPTKDESTHEAQLASSRPLPGDVPKGCLAVYMGKTRQRFVIPISYLNHPLFENLLRLSEEEFRFHYEGGITLPSDVDQFEQVLLAISSNTQRTPL